MLKEGQNNFKKSLRTDRKHSNKLNLLRMLLTALNRNGLSAPNKT